MRETDKAVILVTMMPIIKPQIRTLFLPARPVLSSVIAKNFGHPV